MDIFRKIRGEIVSLLKLSYPIVLAQVGTVLMGLTDTIMLGKVDKANVAAVGVSNQIYFLFTVLGMGTLAAITPMVASSKGAANKKECGEILRTGIELSFLLSVIICLILFAIVKNFELFNQPAEINLVAKEYLRILTVSTIPLMLFLAVKQYSDGLSQTKPAMIITVIAVLINILFNWIFIYGNFTFPAMGARGAAIATLIARTSMALMFVVYVFRNKLYETFLPPVISTFKTAPVLVKLIRIGFPGGLQLFFEVGAFAGAAIFVGWIGTGQLAAHQIVLGLAAVTYMVAAGLSVAGSVRVADAFGKGDKSRIMISATAALTVVSLFMLCCCVIFFLFKTQLIGFFISDDSVISLAGSLLLIAGLFQLSDGIQVVGLGILKAIEDVNMPTLITLFAYWAIGIPLGYYLCFHLDIGISGIWYGLFAGLTFSALLVTVRFYILATSGKTKTYEATSLENVE